MKKLIITVAVMSMVGVGYCVTIWNIKAPDYVSKAVLPIPDGCSYEISYCSKTKLLTVTVKKSEN